MATAKKAATKPVVKRRMAAAAKEAAPVAKRVVRRRKPVVEEPTNPAPAPETVAAAKTADQGFVADSDARNMKVEEASSLQTADIVDLREVNMVGRFAVVMELQLQGYIFDGCSEKDATDVPDMYTGFIQGLRLQHRNKLIFPLWVMTGLQPQALITAPVAARVSAEVVMTPPGIVAPKELNLGGTTYVKTGN